MLAGDAAICPLLRRSQRADFSNVDMELFFRCMCLTMFVACLNDVIGWW